MANFLSSLSSTVTRAFSEYRSVRLHTKFAHRVNALRSHNFTRFILRETDIHFFLNHNYCTEKRFHDLFDKVYIGLQRNRIYNWSKILTVEFSAGPQSQVLVRFWVMREVLRAFGEKKRSSSKKYLSVWDLRPGPLVLTACFSHIKKCLLLCRMTHRAAAASSIFLFVFVFFAFNLQKKSLGLWLCAPKFHPNP